MISLSLQWRRLRTNLSRRRSQTSWSSQQSSRSTKSVRFYAIDTVFYTHSSAEYDRKSPTEEGPDLLAVVGLEQDSLPLDLTSAEDEQTTMNTYQNRRHLKAVMESRPLRSRIVFMP
ncbi:hypothetical protein CLU79DRAFT_754929 [Phycomyces nitens]|nr:hypothetical protein CLU79DRAFT_754929 [Phycomyces nitens]